MTMDTAMSPAPAPSAPAPAASAPRRGNLYAQLWRGVPRELGFLLPLLAIVVVGLTLTASLFFTGIGGIFIIVGVLAVIAALFAARGFGMFELLRLRGAGVPAITPPVWDRVPSEASWFARLMAPVVDGHYWLYLLHTMVVNPIVGIATWTVTIVWTTTAFGGVTYWLWSLWLDPEDRGYGLLDQLRLVMGPDDAAAFVGSPAEIVLAFVVGLLFLATLPFVTHGLVLVHQGIARGMLAAFLSEQLKREVTGLAASRSAAVAAEGTALRRLERDIHDGPQQRLVRLQMDLAAADRQLDGDPAAARALIEEAMQQSKDALEELRSLSRGFAPPILLDRGLVAALESLAVRAALPLTITSALPTDLELPVEVQRNAYFIAAEAITNAAKHSGATVVDVGLRLRDSGLDVVVTDDGHGGAAPAEGHGLAGLDERVRGLGGTLVITSPAGGPTSIAAHLPVA